MNIDSYPFLPKARSKEIIIKEVAGELLIYDSARDRAHCLNETAAEIWTLSDGRTTVSEIGLKLKKAKGDRQKSEGAVLTSTRDPTPDPSYTRDLIPDTQLVWLALDQLRRAHLLEESADAKRQTFGPSAIPGMANMSRREAVRRIGLGAAIALPIVISITAPTAVEAAVSCGAKCHPCNTPADCCGVCVPSVSGCPPGSRCT